MWLFEKGEGWQQQNDCGLSNVLESPLVADVALEAGDGVAWCPASNSQEMMAETLLLEGIVSISCYSE